jgi:hypothetical protein
MRRVTYSMGVSRDGYVVGPDGGFDLPVPTAAVAHLGGWPARLGELERGRRPNDEPAARCRTWLNAA